MANRKAWGMSYLDEFSIEIEERARGKKKMEILIHEAAHLLLPEKGEEEIIKLGVAFTKLLWGEGARFVDDQDTEPMQDGSI